APSAHSGGQQPTPLSLCAQRGMSPSSPRRGPAPSPRPFLDSPSLSEIGPMNTLQLTLTTEVRRRFEPVLRSRGHNATVYAAAAGALAAPAAASFELVVVALTAAGLDGPEVCRRLRAAPGAPGTSSWSSPAAATGAPSRRLSSGALTTTAC